MKKLLILLCVLFASISMQAGRIVRDSLQSKVLGTVRHYSVYLPDAYFMQQERHFPVLYLLHGLSDDDRSWTQKGQVERVCDQLMAGGEIQPMIVVTPEAGGEDTKSIWNGYFNMPGWNYEDFFFQEFMPEVEKKYRAGGSRDKRAISGLSMGGGGCMGYALRHTQDFSSCYAMSAWLYNDEKLSPHHRPGQEKFAALVNAVNEHDPVVFLEKADAKTLEGVKQVAWFLDCGDDDFLLEQNLNLYTRMRSLRIPAQLRVRDGWHSWEYWHSALYLSLPFASRNFQ